MEESSGWAHNGGGGQILIYEYIDKNLLKTDKKSWFTCVKASSDKVDWNFLNHGPCE